VVGRVREVRVEVEGEGGLRGLTGWAEAWGDEEG
jgi:hypothetical protein